MNKSIACLAQRILAPLGLACALAGCTFDAAELRTVDAASGSSSKDAPVDVVVPPSGDAAAADDAQVDAADGAAWVALDGGDRDTTTFDSSDGRGETQTDGAPDGRIPSCPAGTHDDGTGKCVASGCAAGFHDGGSGLCVKSGTCTASYHDNGIGTCVQQGCATGYHDVGGICLLNTVTCTTAGTHDGGNGTCVAATLCATGYHMASSGLCVANLSCPTNELSDDHATCVPAVGTKWTKLADTRAWVGLTMSSDGKRLAGVVDKGYIYVSGDFGETWGAPKPTTGGGLAWSGIAGSADGRNLVATVSGGPAYRSTDYGTIWTTSTGYSYSGKGLVASSDGMQLVTNGGIALYTSIDGGVTWGTRGTPGPVNSVAIEGDGKSMAFVGPSSTIYMSLNMGASWSGVSAPSNAGAVASVDGLAISTDGSRLMILTSGSALVTGSAYNFHVRKGATWASAAFPGSFSTSPLMAVSANNAFILVGVPNGFLYTSSDGGMTWKARTSTAQKWSAVAMSADGTHMVAAENGGSIYTSEGPAQAGTPILGG